MSLYAVLWIGTCVVVPTLAGFIAACWLDAQERRDFAGRRPN